MDNSKKITVSAIGRLADRKPSNRRPTVSAIVPVFDEEKTIAGVITALLDSPRLDEVIVVNDGSSDSSPEIIKSFEPRIKFINLHQNQGKGFALAKGIRKAKGEIITFWDADLIGISDQHIESLLRPILEKEADVVLGYRVVGQNFTSPFKEVTGQRAYYRKDLLPHVSKFKHSRFGVEVYLNNAFKDRRIVRIPWRGLGSLMKYQKFNPQKAVREYVKEGVEIAKTLTQQGIAGMKEDWKAIDKISRENNLDKIRERADRIQNPQIRKILNDYIFRYLKSQK